MNTQHDLSIADADRTAANRNGNDFLVGIGGLIVCAITALVGLWEVTIASEEFAKYVPYPIAQFSVFAGRMIFDTAHAQAVASFWIYLLLWVLHILVFAAAFWIRVHPGIKRSPRLDEILLLTQMAAALSGQQPLFYLFAFELPLVMPRKRAVAWLASGLVLSAAVDIWFMHFPKEQPLFTYAYEVCLNLGYVAMYEVMHFTVGMLAAKERADRQALEKAHARLASANAELLATQMLLSDTVRAAERMRIARDLHDSIGHTLTAQNLHLELAMRKCQSAALDSIVKARGLAKDLLNEVRKMVAVERREEPVNLRQALETYCSNLPSQRIALFCGTELSAISPAIADLILRVVQAAVRNAAQRAGTSPLGISLSEEERGLRLHITDGSGGISAGEEGDRLRHIPADIERLGGEIRMDVVEESKLEIRIWLPRAKTAAYLQP